MSGFQGSYLRILTPETTNGIVPKYDEFNQPIYKESHCANTKVCRTYYEKANLKRPAHLRHIVEVVGEDVPKPTPKPNPTAQNIAAPKRKTPQPNKEVIQNEAE